MRLQIKILWLVIIGIFNMLFKRIRDFLFEKPKRPHPQSGEIFASDHGEVIIELFGEPHSVEVEFVDIEIIPSCAPHHRDDVAFQVFKQHTHHFLLVKWRVNGMREIEWKVTF